MVYDCVIIGGGPAGISAAIYLARFNRRVLVVDSEATGRWKTHEINENYLGFPEGIATVKLRALGKEQAERFGAQFVTDTIRSLEKNNHFLSQGDLTTYESRTVILASGVTDNYPPFDKSEECLGNSLFWCITCDGPKTLKKRVLIVGSSDEALTTALHFLTFTEHIAIVTNRESGNWTLSDEMKTRLSTHHIPVYEGKIATVISEQGKISEVTLAGGETIATDFVFNLQDAVPNSDLAKSLGVKTGRNGYILTDHEQRTNRDRFYAAGDVTKLFSHQIVTAAHEGATAATTANYDLYHAYQKER